MADYPQMNDPAKALGYFRDKMAYTTGPIELKRWMDQKGRINIVDVRRAEDYQEGHIPGAVNVPKERWDSPAGLSKDRMNVLYCYSQVCHLAATAAIEFASKGFPVMELEGGFDTWQKFELPIETGAAAAAR